MDGVFWAAHIIAAHSAVRRLTAVSAFDWLQKPMVLKCGSSRVARVMILIVSYVDILSERSLRRLLHNSKAVSS